MKHSNDHRRRAISLLEVVIVVAILGALVALSVPVYKRVKEKMKEVVCIARMKRIYHALDDYVKENGHWPQPPEVEGFQSEQDEWRWWILTLKDYGVASEHWLCPVEEDGMKNAGPRPEYAVSYVPSEFDKRQMTPYRWNQPWLTERGNFHGKGNHMLMPDGSIKPSPVRATFQGR